MVIGNTRLLPRMSVGYEPVCFSKPGLWPCFPMMSRFGFGRLGARNPVVPQYGIAGLGQTDPSTPVDLTDSSGLVQLPQSAANVVSAFSGFGWPEWLLIGGVAYMFLSSFLTAKRGVGAVTGAVKKRRRKVQKRRLEEAEAGGAFFGLL